MDLTLVLPLPCGVRILGLEVHRQAPPQPAGEIVRLLALLEVDHVVDVGANTGQFARGLRQLGFTGRIDSIEPIPACAAAIRESADDDWHVHECAIGDTPGTATLRIYRDTSLSSFHDLNQLGRDVWDDPATADELERIDVEVRTLDDLLGSIARGSRIWVKCDTQGHDLAALASLRQYLPNVAGLQTEIAFTSLYDDSPAPDDHLRFVRDMGFTLAGLFPIGRVNGGAITEADCLFVRA